MNKIDKLYEIILSDSPSEMIRRNEDFIFSIIPELELSKGFNQNNKWHIYDVYEHILHVVDGVECDLELRLSALFHDIGKPYVYTCDENNIGHFYGHWEKSNEIFLNFSKKYCLDKELIKRVSLLIFYHDKNISRSKDDIKLFNSELLHKLYLLKKSDLLAQSSEYHYLIDKLNDEEKIILKK